MVEKKYIQCPHCKEENGYLFELEDWEIDLCRDCFYLLLADMKKQETIDIWADKLEMNKRDRS